MDSLRERLTAALPRAMKDRDRVAVAALRSALAALDNSEAVPVQTGAGTRVVARVGVGTTEVERRRLSELEVRGIVLAEVAERVDAARTYDRVGMPEQAARTRAEAAALRVFLD